MVLRNVIAACREATLALAVLGISASLAHAADDDKKCTVQFAATLDMRTGEDGRVSIPVKLENRELYFLIDTGGVVSTVDSHVAAAAHLTEHLAGATLYGIGGAQLNHYVKAENFSIGRLVGKNNLFYIQPSNWRGTAGSIAPEILRAYDDDFDFAAGKFHLVSPDHCPGQVVYWTQDGPFAVVPMEIDLRSGHMRIPVAVDGKEIRATVDTGAETSVMSLSAAHNFLGFDETKPDVKTSGSEGHKVYRYPFKALDFEGIGVANPYILILPDSDMRFLGSDLILGIGILRQLHMYIAYRERKIYFTPATAH